MSLPELEWQMIYGRLAWAIVLAGLVAAVWPRPWRLSRKSMALVMIGSAVMQALPNELSPAYWLGLAFQSPSGLLVGLCVIRLYFGWQGRRSDPAMTMGLAVPISLAGGVLYLEAIGLISLGMYYRGFGPYGAPALALLIAVACSLQAVRNSARPQALAVLAAMTLFAVTRLPTGNFWDTLLDPFL